jgi:hypothetical protein
MVKPRERNTRYVDAVMTVPKNCLYSMSSLNLAFDRQLIGPAMYCGSLLADDKAVDDMWTGWCSKVVCDHLGYGEFKDFISCSQHATSHSRLQSLAQSPLPLPDLT